MRLNGYNVDMFDESNELETSTTKNKESSGPVLRILKIAEDFQDHTNAEHDNENNINEWKMVASVLDRCFVYVFGFVSVVMAIVIFAQPYFHAEDSYRERIY